MTASPVRFRGRRPTSRGAALLALALAFTVAAAAPEATAAQQDDPARTARIDRIERSLVRPLQVEGLPVVEALLADRMAHYGVPGVSIAVIDGGAVAWEKAYGVKDVETGEPVTTETLFQAASISKPVSVMGMLRLVEGARLDLDENVNEYLKSWKVPAHDFGETVTLRRLASHTAGTTVHGFPGYARSAERPATPGVLRGEGNTDPVVVDLEPGLRFRYSGGGTTILQLVVEDVTDRPFPEYMADAVLGPAGLTHSTFAQPLPEERWDDAASGHRPDGSKVEEDWHVYPEMAAAGLWTTPGDLARLGVEVQRSLGGESNRVLSQAMTEAMLEPVMDGYGLGFGTQPGPTGRFGHGGANEGFRANLVAFRDGRGVVVMTNSDRGGLLAQEILAAVGREYGWTELQPETLTRYDLPEVRRAALAGRYTVPAMGGFTLTLTATVDGLFDVASDRLPASTLVPVSATDLIDLSDGTRIAIEWDGDRVVRLRTQGVEVVPSP